MIQTGNYASTPPPPSEKCVNNEPLTGFSKSITPVAGPFDTQDQAADWLNNNFEYFAQICKTT